MRGSVNGMTYSANQFAPIICRARTYPSHFGSNDQNLAMAAFGTATSKWATLDPVVRDAFIQAKVQRNKYIGNVAWLEYATSKGMLNVPYDSVTPPLEGEVPIFSALMQVYSGLPDTYGVNILVTNQQVRKLFCVVQLSVPFEPTRYAFRGPWDPTLFQSDVIDAATPIPYTPTQEVFTFILPESYANKVVFARIQGALFETTQGRAPNQYLRLPVVHTLLGSKSATPAKTV